jgi:hypothetical protein
MTDHGSVELGWVPQACTLPTAERPLRQAEFDDLFAASMRGAERVAPQHLRVTLSGGPDLAHAVRDLADRETQCCSFFSFSVDAPRRGVVQLDIEVSVEHVDVLDALESRSALVRSQP